MTKTFKIWLILAISVVLTVSMTLLVITNTKNQPINYWWQAGLAALALIGGGLGMLTSKHWSWLKSDVGKGVFFLSSGLVAWGVGQLFWAYALLKNNATQAPLNNSLNIIDLIFILILPVIIYGMVKLSKATGAKYALKRMDAKILIAYFSVLLITTSCYVLIVNGGGASYFTDNSTLRVIYNLGIPIMDAINLVIAVSIVVLSWKLLGGKFRNSIFVLAIGFVLLFVSDFAYSYLDGRGQFYNGHWADLFYVFTFAIFGVAMCSLDPTKKLAQSKK